MTGQPVRFVTLQDIQSELDGNELAAWRDICLLYTSDAADERSSVDLGGRRIIKKKKAAHTHTDTTDQRSVDSATTS